MQKRVCVFIDGENFRKSICTLFEKFDRRQYLPRTDWGNVFDNFVDQAEQDCERIRAYWYVIEHLDFFPYRLRAASKDQQQLMSILSKKRQFEQELRQLQGNQLEQRMEAIVKDLLTEKDKMRRRFDGWTTMQEAISSTNRGIEFRRAGANTYNLFYGSFGTEKAVDVKLASDLIVLRDIYDIAVIVSGDQDFVPAVRTVKDFGKQVVNVAFETRGGKLLPGGARRLNNVTDWSLRMQHDGLSKLLFPN